MILSQLKKLFFEAEEHAPVLDQLRADSSTNHVSSGMAQLLTPDGERNLIVSVWYAKNWCKVHPSWKWEAL